MTRSTGSGKRPYLTSTGLAGHQIRHEAAALPGTPDQNVYLAPRQAQRLSRHIGRFVPDRLRLRQRTDDLRTTARTLPSLIRQSGHALFWNPWVSAAMLTSLWCTRVLSIVEIGADHF